MEAVHVEEIDLTLVWEFPTVRNWDMDTTNRYFNMIAMADYHFKLMTVESVDRFYIAKNPYGQKVFDTPLYHYLKRHYPSIAVTPYGLVFDDKDTLMLKMVFG